LAQFFAVDDFPGPLQQQEKKAKGLFLNLDFRAPPPQHPVI
jgi:hypothetical protein